MLYIPTYTGGIVFLDFAEKGWPAASPLKQVKCCMFPGGIVFTCCCRKASQWLLPLNQVRCMFIEVGDIILPVAGMSASGGYP